MTSSCMRMGTGFTPSRFRRIIRATAHLKSSKTPDGRVRRIIEDAAASHAAECTPEQKIGDYYSSFIDEAQIESRGLAPIAADLDRIRRASTLKEIATLFGSPGFVSTFEVSFPPDLADPSHYSVALEQAGLGLPDRDYYLKDDPRLKSV